MGPCTLLTFNRMSTNIKVIFTGFPDWPSLQVYTAQRSCSGPELNAKQQLGNVAGSSSNWASEHRSDEFE